MASTSDQRERASFEMTEMVSLLQDDAKEDVAIEDLLEEDDNSPIIQADWDVQAEWDALPQLTFRAIAVGVFLGSIISASNMYMGLKIGWTFTASIFGAIFGYSILATLQKSFNLTKLGPKEHCAIQTAATAAGSGTTAGYVSGIPAMYRLGLLTDPFGGDLKKLFVWALAASFYGIFFSIPLRKYFILKQKLPFPSPTAAAEVIRSLNTFNGSQNARKKTIAMAAVFIFVCTWLILAFFIPILKDWQVFRWLGEATSNPAFLAAHTWSFYLSANPAFFGAGLMAPPSTGVSSLVGSIVAWGIIGPYLLHVGITYSPLKFGADVTNEPSSRYWLLWPGITMMVASSFAELGCRWKMFARAFGGFLGKKKYQRVDTLRNEDDNDIDPAPPREQVPALWWGTGLAASILLSILVLKNVWDVGFGEIILAILIGLILSFIAIQSSGETDINPTGSIAKTSQIVLSAFPPLNPFPGPELVAKQTTSLAAGLLAASAAHQSVDMVGDLKTGHLLGASPRVQFVAQSIGALVSVFTGLALWILFIKAYPCIINTDAEDECRSFTLQAVAAWQGITMALTTKNAIPPSSLYTSIFLGIFIVIFTVIKNTLIPARYHFYLPNFNAIGIAFANTDQSIMISLCAGSLVGLLWKRRWASNYEMYMFAIAAGLIAGEGIYGVLEAVLTIGGMERGSWLSIGWQ